MVEDSIITSLHITPKLKPKLLSNKLENKFVEKTTNTICVNRKNQQNGNMGNLENSGGIDETIVLNNANKLHKEIYITDKSNGMGKCNIVKSSITVNPLTDIKKKDNASQLLKDKHSIDVNHNNVSNSFNENTSLDHNKNKNIIVKQNKPNIRIQQKPTVKSRVIKIEIGKTAALPSNNNKVDSKNVKNTDMKNFDDTNMGGLDNHNVQLDLTKSLEECIKVLENDSKMLQKQAKNFMDKSDVDSREMNEDFYISSENIYENSQLFLKLNESREQLLSNNDCNNLRNVSNENESNTFLRSSQQDRTSHKIIDRNVNATNIDESDHEKFTEKDESMEDMDKVSNLSNRFRSKSTPRKPKRSFDRQKPLLQPDDIKSKLSSSLGDITQMTENEALFKGLKVQLDNENKVFISKEDFDEFVAKNKDKYSGKVKNEEEFLSQLDSALKMESSNIAISSSLGSQDYLSEKSNILSLSKVSTNENDDSKSMSPLIDEAELQNDFEFLMQDFKMGPSYYDREYFTDNSTSNISKDESSYKDFDSNFSETFSDTESFGTIASSTTTCSHRKNSDKDFQSESSKSNDKTLLRAEELGIVLDTQMEQLETLLAQSRSNSLSNPSHNLLYTVNQIQNTPLQKSVDQTLETTNFTGDCNVAYMDEDSGQLEIEYRPPTFQPLRSIENENEINSFGSGRIRKSFKNARKKLSKLKQRIGSKKGDYQIHNENNCNQNSNSKGEFEKEIEQRGTPERFKNDYRTSQMMGVEYERIKKELDEERRQVRGMESPGCNIL